MLLKFLIKRNVIGHFWTWYDDESLKMVVSDRYVEDFILENAMVSVVIRRELNFLYEVARWTIKRLRKEL